MEVWPLVILELVIRCYDKGNFMHQLSLYRYCRDSTTINQQRKNPQLLEWFN